MLRPEPPRHGALGQRGHKMVGQSAVLPPGIIFILWVFWRVGLLLSLKQVASQIPLPLKTDGSSNFEELELFECVYKPSSLLSILLFNNQLRKF